MNLFESIHFEFTHFISPIYGMVEKGEYKRETYQSPPSEIETQLLKYVAEKNQIVVTFGQYAKTRVNFSPIRNTTGTATKMKGQKPVGILSEQSILFQKKMITRNYTTIEGIKFELHDPLQQVPKLTVRKQQKKKVPKMNSPQPRSSKYLFGIPGVALFPPGSLLISPTHHSLSCQVLA